MLLSSGYAPIVGFLPAMTRIPKAELFAEGVAREINSVPLEIADQCLDGLLGLDLLGVEVTQVSDGRVYAAAPKPGEQSSQHGVADLGPATPGAEFLGTFHLQRKPVEPDTFRSESG